MRTCVRCGKTKDESEFNWRNIKKGYLQSICRNCQQEQGRERYQNNPEGVKEINRNAREKGAEEAQRFLYEYLLNSRCEDCGEKDITVLTFHHTSAKKMNISDMVSHGYAVESIRGELAHTIVLCWNCHMRREHKERGGRFKRFCSFE
jgi:hypothetical protein